MKRHVVLMLSVTLALSGCASYRPVVDSKGVDMNRYEQDLKECQVYAEQESPAASAAIGTVAGAAIGALLAAAAGSGYDRNASARVGAVAGALGGTGQGAEAQINIIRNCMSGRGYKVLR